MAQINVNNLTFYYEGSADYIFESVSFSIDTDWKLGFIGRNGKGKTRFLNLLLGKYEYTGSISTSTVFDYFPYQIKDEYLDQPAAEFVEELKAGCEQWRIVCELDRLGLDVEVLYRPFGTLSPGERTKVMLAASLLTPAHLYIWDEPLNYIDVFSRMQIEKLQIDYQPTMLVVEHDERFREKIATKTIRIGE